MKMTLQEKLVQRGISLDPKAHRRFKVEANPVEIDESESTITHYISTPDLDRGRDKVNPHGMVDVDFSKSPTVFFNHNYNRPIGASLWRKRSDEGVLAKTRFAKTDFAKDILVLHKDGIINTWSIGWAPLFDVKGNLLPGSLEYDDDNDILHIQKWELGEYSSAPMAMNPNALDTVKKLVKSFEMQSIISDYENQEKINSALKSLEGYMNKIAELDAMLKQLQKTEERVSIIEGDVAEITALIKEKIKNVSEQVIESTGVLVDSKIIDEIIQKKINGDTSSL